MNIYYASLYYKNDHVTGANKRFDEIGKRLLKKYNISFRCIVIQDNKPNWCPVENCIFVRPYSSKLGRLISWLHFSLLMYQLDAGIFINDFMPTPICLFKNKHRHFQLIHDLRNFEEFKRGGLSFLTAYFQKWQLSKAHKIITVSKYTASMLNKFNIKKEADIIVSYNGVDGRVFESNKKISIDILYIATFEPRKNHIQLLKALAMFPTPLNITFVGSDLGLKAQVQQYASEVSEQCGHKITFYEQVSNEELNNLYSSANVFCSPSLYEGFGMPIVEAYQHRCQVVCSDIDVFREVTLNKATYFDPHSEGDIYQKLTFALNRTDDDELTHTSNLVVDFFSWDGIFDRLCESLGDNNNE
jgi:glycosyltransferase involved in cell wall biosynthesis